MTPERRLTAILAADVAGYSRLMGADEEGTLAALKANRRALVDPKITEHRGRIVKTTGDGMLVEFASVVDAVRCAVHIQRGMIERNLDLPQDKRIEFRVGIHQGDVVIEDQDIFGDGVNARVVDDDREAIGSKPLRDGGADSPRGTGDDRDFAVCIGHLPSPYFPAADRHTSAPPPSTLSASPVP